MSVENMDLFGNSKQEKEEKFSIDILENLCNDALYSISDLVYTKSDTY